MPETRRVLGMVVAALVLGVVLWSAEPIDTEVYGHAGCGIGYTYNATTETCEPADLMTNVNAEDSVPNCEKTDAIGPTFLWCPFPVGLLGAGFIIFGAFGLMLRGARELYLDQQEGHP